MKKKTQNLTNKPTELFYSTLNLSPIPKPLLKEQPEPKELHLFSLDNEKTPLFSLELSAVFNDMKVNSLNIRLYWFNLTYFVKEYRNFS